MIETGLDNLGNTCYLNSIIQALRFSPGIYDIINKYENKQSICYYLSIIYKCMLTDDECDILIPENFVKYLKIIFNKYKINSQQDCQEILLEIIERLHFEIKSNNIDWKSIIPYIIIPNNKIDIIKKEFDKILSLYWNDTYSPIYKKFQMIQTSKIKCLNCNKYNYTFEPSLTLNLNIIADSLIDCIKHYQRCEKMTDSNKYYCNNCCKETNATKISGLCLYPEILIIQLNRFINVDDDTLKITTLVSYPNNLTLSKYNYNLYCIICHQGRNLHHGHYYAICFDKISNKWYKYDDDDVETVTGTLPVIRFPTRSAELVRMFFAPAFTTFGPPGARVLYFTITIPEPPLPP